MKFSLAHSWRDACGIWTSPFGKLFLYSSVKTLRGVYYFIAQRLWPLVGMVAFLIWLDAKNLESRLPELVEGGLVFGQTLLLFFIMLFIRPSRAPKTYLYLFSYTLQFGIFFTTMMALLVLSGSDYLSLPGIAMLIDLFFRLFSFGFLSFQYVGHSRHFLLLAFSPVVLFFALFLCDAPLHIFCWLSAARNSLLFLWYNLPPIFCVYFVSFATLLPVFRYTSKPVATCLLLLMVPVFYTLYSTIYIKRVRDQLGLYL